jgi:hypothetical protein
LPCVWRVISEEGYMNSRLPVAKLREGSMSKSLFFTLLLSPRVEARHYTRVSTVITGKN